MNKPAEPAVADPRRIPYAKPQPWGMAPDMVIHDVLTDDEKLWAPVAPDIWSRPIQMNVTGGFYTHLLRVRRSGVIRAVVGFCASVVRHKTCAPWRRQAASSASGIRP